LEFGVEFHHRRRPENSFPTLQDRETSVASNILLNRSTIDERLFRCASTYSPAGPYWSNWCFVTPSSSGSSMMFLHTPRVISCVPFCARVLCAFICGDMDLCPDYPLASSLGIGSALGSSSIICMRSSLKMSSVPCVGTCGALWAVRTKR